MLIGQLKAGLVVIFAITFGVVQMACACIDAKASSVSLPDMVSTTTHHNADVAHDYHGSKQHSENIEKKSKPSQQHEGGHDNHQKDCSHCDGFNTYVSGADQAVIPIVPSQSSDTAILADPISKPFTPAIMAPTALAGLRWLDPPPPTLITLKIRLTI